MITLFERSNTITVNGITAYELGTSLSGVQGSTLASYGKLYAKNYDIEVLHADSSFTVLATHIAGYTPAGSPPREYMANSTWSCPETALLPTDALYITIRSYIGFPPIYEILTQFTTSQLGAEHLHASTWTFYSYWKDIRPSLPSGYYSDLYWDTPTYNTRIKGMDYRAASPFPTYYRP